MPLNKEVDFLQEVIKQVNFPFDRKSIYKELAGHLEEAKEEYLDQHLDLDDASHKAIEDMGDPIEIGRSLNQVHRPIWGWIWIVSKYTMILMLFFVVFQGSKTMYAHYQSSMRLEPYTKPIEELFIGFTKTRDASDFIFDEILGQSIDLGDHTLIFERITLHKEGVLILIYQEVVPFKPFGLQSAKHPIELFLTLSSNQHPLSLYQSGMDGVDGYSVIIVKDVPSECRKFILEYDGYNETFELVIDVGGSS